MEEVDGEPPAQEPVVDPVESAEPAEPEFPPEGFERWRRDSALGSVGTGIARGLQNVFGTPQDQVVMVAPIPGGPPDPDRLQVILDPDDPTKSIAVLPPADSTSPSDPSDPTPNPTQKD